MSKYFNITFFKELFQFKNSSRSDKAKKNIVILFLLQVFNFFTLMAIVPLTLNYLGKTDYGIWLTLASILNWLINLDFGLGNGLRNKLAEAFALNDIKLARFYISTAYAVFTIGIAAAFIIYVTIHGLLNWGNILQAPDGYTSLLNSLVLYVIILFLVHFLLKLIASVINADQRPALNGGLSLIINTITLIGIYLLSKYAQPSLTLFGLVSSGIPVLVFFIASIILFGGYFRNISPSLKYVNLEYSSSLVKLGMQFFVIQISSLIVFTSGNIIITQLYGPKSVVTYNIAYKYFYMVPLVFNVVLAPFWSAFTEAYVKKEYNWIKNSVKKLIIIWAMLSIVTIVMLIFSEFIYEQWVGSQIKVPFILSLTISAFVMIANWNNIFGTFINGVGKVRIQLYYSIFAAVLNIPLSIFLSRHLGIGVTGVMLSTNICLIFGSFLFPIQYYKLVRDKAKGIWDK